MSNYANLGGSDEFLRILQRTGNFNFADPSEESINIDVHLPEYNFNEAFKFKPGEIDLSGLAWDQAIETITRRDHRYIGQKKDSKRLRELLEENRNEIRREYIEYRLAKITGEEEQLREEQERLEEEVKSLE